jgi:hypothetical protein
MDLFVGSLFCFIGLYAFMPEPSSFDYYAFKQILDQDQ